MKFLDTPLPGVKLIEPQVFGDERGFFLEVWHSEKFAAQGVDVPFVQDNHSRSAQGILRGIHYQIVEPQGKLVRCTHGRVFDVAVDLRQSSPMFKHWYGLELSAENKSQLWIPEGFGHAFLALTDEAEVQYKCTAPYRPEYDRALAWNDPDLAIDWPLAGQTPHLSAKDQAAPGLADADLFP